MLFKVNAARRHHIPLTAVMLRAVDRLARRQTEGLVGSRVQLLGIALAVRDHSTLSRRARGVAIPALPKVSGPVHLLVDSSGVKLYGPGDWLVEKHRTQRRRAWKTRHVGLDVSTGRIVAATLTDHDVDDAWQVRPLLDQGDGPLAAFIADGAYDQSGVDEAVAECQPDAAVIVPPRSTAVPSTTAGPFRQRRGRSPQPTQRDQHLQEIAERGRMEWQTSSRDNSRALVEAFFSRCKRVIGNGLRFQTDDRQNTEITVAVLVPNRRLDLGRPESVRLAERGWLSTPATVVTASRQHGFT